MNKYLLTSLATIFMAGTAISQPTPSQSVPLGVGVDDKKGSGSPIQADDPSDAVHTTGTPDGKGSSGSDGDAVPTTGTPDGEGSSGSDGTLATGVAADSGGSEATATNTSGDGGTSGTGVAPEQ